MQQHSAWLTTDRTCLDGDLCDVVVLRDEIIGYREQNGAEVPVWESTGDPLFHSEINLRHDADTFEQAIPLAVEALVNGGWRATHGASWEPVGTGLTITVERAE